MTSAVWGVVHQSSVLVYSRRDALAHGLCQRRFRPGQPEGHVHGAVPRDRRGQLDAGIVASPQPDVELPKAAVAVRRERAHAKVLCKGEGLAVPTHAGSPSAEA
jgi:hypothetical protein